MSDSDAESTPGDVATNPVEPAASPEALRAENARLQAENARLRSSPSGTSGVNNVESHCVEEMQRYEPVVRHSPDIVLLMRRDDGQILEANAAATASYGYEHDELLTLTIHDLRSPESSSLTTAQIAEANARGILFETVHRRKDGSTFPVEVSSLGATIGNTPTFVSIVKDVTERRRAEMALQQNEERYRGFFDNITEGVVVLEAVRDDLGAIIDWRCTAANEAQRRLFGLAPNDIIGSLRGEVMGRTWLHRLHPRSCRVLATGEPVAEEIDVNDRHLISTAFRINAETVGITALDVTDRKRAEQEREGPQRWPWQGHGVCDPSARRKPVGLATRCGNAPLGSPPTSARAHHRRQRRCG
jgi:PAS domain S-box-containing protein